MNAELETPEQVAIANDVAPPAHLDNLGSVFNNAQAFELAVRMAEVLAKATAIPLSYQSNPANCLIAIDYAMRLRVSPAVLMQNMGLDNGRPALTGAFMIAVINACGFFSRLRFEWQGIQDDGTGKPSDDYGCRAVATDLLTSEVLHGNFVTWATVVAEGWNREDGDVPSKWNTMREQMFQYRAASFWGRVHSPDITLGLHTSDEVEELPQRGSRKAKATAETENAIASLTQHLAARAPAQMAVEFTTEAAPSSSDRQLEIGSVSVEPPAPTRRRKSRAPIE